MKKNHKLVKQAKKLSSSELDDFIVHPHPNLLNNCQIKFNHADELSNERRKEITQLFEVNMKAIYEQSNGGYNFDEKQEELFSDQSRYLCILSSNDVLSFAHFRFDMDYDSHVIYLYELQVKNTYQGQGYGYIIVEQLKVLCRKTQMSKIVLTVHKANKKAIDFYKKKCLFEIDITDPSDEPVDYVILSFIV